MLHTKYFTGDGFVNLGSKKERQKIMTTSYNHRFGRGNLTFGYKSEKEMAYLYTKDTPKNVADKLTVYMNHNGCATTDKSLWFKKLGTEYVYILKVSPKPSRFKDMLLKYKHTDGNKFKIMDLGKHGDKNGV